MWGWVCVVLCCDGLVILVGLYSIIVCYITLCYIDFAAFCGGLYYCGVDLPCCGVGFVCCTLSVC